MCSMKVVLIIRIFLLCATEEFLWRNQRKKRIINHKKTITVYVITVLME